MNIMMIGIPALSVVVYVVVLLLISFSKRDKLISSYMGYVAVLLGWCLSSLLMRLQVPPNSLFWNRFMLDFTILVPLALLHFSNQYTRISRPFSTLICLIFTFVMIALNHMGLVVKEVTFDKFGNMKYPMDWGSYLVYAHSAFFVMYANVNLIRMLRSHPKKINPEKYSVIGITLLLASAGLNFVPSIGKYPVDIFFSVVNAVMIGYSIFYFRFLNIRWVIRRGLIYSGMMLLLTTAYVVVITVITDLLKKKANFPIFVVVLIIFAALIILLPVKNFFRSLIDRVYFRNEYEQKKVLRTFNQSMIQILNLDELCHSLTDAIQKGIGCNQVHFLLSDDKNGNLHLYDVGQPIEAGELILTKNHPIVRWFENPANIYLGSEQIERLPFFKGVWKKELDAFEKMHMEIIIPIRKRSQMIGMFLLSEKENGHNYSSDDIELLTTLSNSSAVMIENAVLYQQAKTEAITDNLTGLFNHRHFYNELSTQTQLSSNRKLALLMADMDHFKLYNDLYGHPSGDEALRQMADIFKNTIGEMGQVFRYGGEEFAVILPDCDNVSATIIAEELRRSVENHFAKSCDKVHRFLTISIGIAIFPDCARKHEELLKNADIALYDAKMSGKNKTVLYQGSAKQDDEISKQEQDDIYSFYSSPVYALAAAIDAKDHYTFNHSKNVARFASRLARLAGLSDRQVQLVYQAGLLHDVGKIGVPEEVLNKPGKLSDTEYDLIKQHVSNSIAIIKHSPALNRIIPAVLYHHERWDGRGYLNGLADEAIPIEARCLSLADAYDAMVNDRPYRTARSIEEALAEIERGIGTQFDPNLAPVFIKMVQELPTGTGLDFDAVIEI